MHKPVLLKEVVEYLNPQPGMRIVDATISGGGHTFGLLEKCPDIKILGIELDPEIAKSLGSKIEELGLQEKISLVNSSYINIKNICRDNSFSPDGILFDLGLSSWHYETSGRGFSFQKEDELLDMRFSPEKGTLTAAEIVNLSDPREIQRIISEYGEEGFAREITAKIIETRRGGPIVTTGDLVNVINAAVPEWYKHKKINPATKTFQALRIAVNGELENIKLGVKDALDILNPGGRLAIISFHGLEDKIIKEFFKSKVGEGIISLPHKKAIQAEWQEVRQNPKARSAKLRIAEKLNI